MIEVENYLRNGYTVEWSYLEFEAAVNKNRPIKPKEKKTKQKARI
jgi:hypothetical protein